MSTLDAQPGGSLFIGGALRPGRGEIVEDIYPATGETIAEIRHAAREEVDEAVAAARDAQAGWAATPAAERGAVLARAAAIIRERNEELSRLETLDTGKPISETLVADALSGADCLDFYAGAEALLSPERIAVGGDEVEIERLPHGVVGAIGAWNYPIQIACWKAAPALACGNTMVFKPSEMTPLSALALAGILSEAGLPDGCFNDVQGAGEVGARLAGHEDVDKVSVTGSVPTGRKVYAAAAERLKPVTLELGGKSPIIVCADADIDNAVTGALLGNFYSSGQICSNGTRVFVHRSVVNEFLQRAHERVDRMTIGDPLDPATHIGPLISAAQRDRVMAFITTGKRRAKLVCGGRTVHPQGFENGFFVAPTIFLADDDSAPIVRDEIFGPVMTVLTFGDEDEAVRRANATEYGLACGVYSADTGRARRIVSRLKAGTAWINAYNLTPIEMPFGGMKQSGIGRENGRGGIEAYSQLRGIYTGRGAQDAPY
ncbi:MAG: betaine-aldehyde dehydrogenase [Flavobacteriaceae bacterium]